MNLKLLAVPTLLLLLGTHSLPAQTPHERLGTLLDAAKVAGFARSAVGVTRQGTPIASLIANNDWDYATDKTRLLLIGGLDADQASVQAALSSLQWFSTADPKLRARFTVSAVPCANPDGWAAANHGGPPYAGNPTRGYPPQGEAYNSPTDPEAAYLWRWIGMHAPDLVVDLRGGKQRQWRIPKSDLEPLNRLAKSLSPVAETRGDDELVTQLARAKPCNVGSIPALQVELGAASEFLPELLAALDNSSFREPSPARREIQARLNRTPLEVATQLSKVYGHELSQVVYIPAVALIGRVRLGEQTGNSEHLADVERIVQPYFSGQKPSMPAKPSGSDLSGHLVFGELARLTKKPRYIELARVAADMGFDAGGQPKPSMPFHSEMSDAVFMGCPILAQVGHLTGETRYYDQCLNHMRFMLKLNLREDGLHRHSPLDQTAWGRGNGFPALGLALSLAEIPAQHPGRDELLRAFQTHLAALSKHQDPTGCWHQVVDLPDSYRELSCTCMITYAMARGVRSGWLERAKYEPLIERGWHAIRTRVAADGGLVDVCTGTGKQKSLRDYYDRPALLGKDGRGGAMSLLVATEMALWEAEKSR